MALTLDEQVSAAGGILTALVRAGASRKTISSSAASLLRSIALGHFNETIGLVLEKDDRALPMVQALEAHDRLNLRNGVVSHNMSQAIQRSDAGRAI